MIIGHGVFIDGLPEMEARLARAELSLPQVIGMGLSAEAQIIFRMSQIQVPFRKGILKGSGNVSLPTPDGDGISVDISYGGAAKAYAYIMHRGTMNGRPINYRNGKKGQYLKDPVDAAIPGMDERLAIRIREILA